MAIFQKLGWRLGLVGAALALGGCGGGEPKSPAEAARPAPAKTVIFAVENGYVPFNFIHTATRQAVGWDYDMAAELGRRLGFTPEFREIAWDSMIQGVATGQFDAGGNGVTITEERARVVDFSDGYMDVTQRILVRVEETRFDTLETFARTAKAKLGAQKGTTNYDRAERLVGAERVAAYDGFGELIQALLNRDLDAVLIDDLAGQGYVGASRERLRLLPGGLPPQPLGFIFPQGSPWRAEFNRALAEMRADGTLAQINARWFAPGFTPEGAPLP